MDGVCSMGVTVGGQGRINIEPIEMDERTSSSAWAKLWLASTSILSPCDASDGRDRSSGQWAWHVVVRVYVRVLLCRLMCGYERRSCYDRRATAFGVVGVVHKRRPRRSFRSLPTPPKCGDARRGPAHPSCAHQLRSIRGLMRSIGQCWDGGARRVRYFLKRSRAVGNVGCVFAF